MALDIYWLPSDLWKPIVDEPGLNSMTMQGRREDAKGGTLRIKVEPSAKVEFGVYIEVNEEFKAPKDDEAGARWASNRLAEHWDGILIFAGVAAEHLLNLTN